MKSATHRFAIDVCVTLRAEFPAETGIAHPQGGLAERHTDVGCKPMWRVGCKSTIAALLLTLLLAVPTAHAQDIPRLSGVFPAGAQAGQTVDVSVRGSALLGAKAVWFARAGGVVDAGVTGQIAGGTVAVDASAKPLHQAKCANCHELRSPANRSLSPEQWTDRKSTRLNSSHSTLSRMPSSA